MIAQPSDIICVASTRSTDQTGGGTGLEIVRSVVDKVIEVSVDDGYSVIGSGVDIHIGYNVIHAGLVIHKVLMCLKRWTVDNQLLRNRLCGQTIQI